MDWIVFSVNLPKNKLFYLTKIQKYLASLSDFTTLGRGDHFM